MTDSTVHQMIEQMKTITPQPVEVTLPLIKLDVQPNMNILIKKLGLLAFRDLFCLSASLLIHTPNSTPPLSSLLHSARKILL